jgi:nucleoside-diphosphate-sugar epimerase
MRIFVTGASGHIGSAVVPELIQAGHEVIGLTRTGDTRRDAVTDANPRSAVSRTIAGFTARGVRTVLVAVPPVTHSTWDKIGFIPTLIKIARDTGVSGYVGDGANRWPAGHALDIGHLYQLAVEKAPAGSQLYAAAEEGITVREIAETIGRHLDVPAVSIPAEQAADHFQAVAGLGAGSPWPNRRPRRRLLLRH